MRGRVWGEVLGIATPEPDDDFFLLGGDSLSALAVAKRLVEWDGITRCARTAGVRVRGAACACPVPASSCARAADPGGEWPPDGIVHGPLAPQALCEHPTLAQYSQHVDVSGAAMNWQVGMLHRGARARTDGAQDANHTA